MQIDGAIKFLLIMFILISMAWLNEYYPLINVVIVLFGLCMAIYLVSMANMRDRK